MDKLKNKLIIKLIPKYQNMFRILDKWKIVYEDDGVYGDQCCHNGTKRIATIYPVTVKTDMDDYVLHELLHICQCELRKKSKYLVKRKKEEMFIQDICKIINIK